MRRDATPACFASAAHISAVVPRRFSRAPTFAPPASRYLTPAAVPLRAAVMRGVSPSAETAFALAPASSRRLIISPLPFAAASASGVTPYRLGRSGCAPARISRSATSAASRRTAQCRGVVPSTPAALTSAPAFSSVRTAAASDAFTASRSGSASRASARTVPVRSTTRQAVAKRRRLMTMIPLSRVAFGHPHGCQYLTVSPMRMRRPGRIAVTRSRLGPNTLVCPVTGLAFSALKMLSSGRISRPDARMVFEKLTSS